MTIQSFEQLEVWQRAHQMVLHIYRTSADFPAEERFGLTAQFRRAAVSVAANIAEGFRRRTNKDKAHFYNLSQGSLEEVRYYFILARDLSYISNIAPSIRALDEVSRMLSALIRSVKERSE